MKNRLSDHDRRRLDKRVAETEKRTRTQIVLSVIQRSDAYAELPWKAFAMGTSAAGLIFFLLYWWLYDWYPPAPALIMALGILLFGALSALLAVISPQYAQCFLSGYRAEVEVRQYANTLFLERELFATRQRTGILVLVSLFERRVVMLPDKGVQERLQEEDIQNMIAAMTPSLKRNQISEAFDAGLDYLSRTLATSAPEAFDDELPNAMIEEEGI